METVTICDKGMCNGCMACVEKCPSKCISIKDDIFEYNAVKNVNSCIVCGICEKICPRISKVNKKKPYIWYQGWAEDAIRLKSSSGGAASAMIHRFIINGGYVASCLFIDGQFRFEITNNLDIAKRFAGSKYVKSNPIGIYRAIKDKLKTDKVLFIGLPCQVAGLKNYVGDKANLYTIDLICHGTPSPKLLYKYLAEHSIDIAKTDELKFRDSTTMGIICDAKKVCSEGTDDYMLAFLDAVDYTDNCYNCDYSTFERVSDVTLGDSWDTEYHEEEKKGVSLILIQSSRGEELVSGSKIETKQVDIERAVIANHQLSHPSVKTEKRTQFVQLIRSGKSFSYVTLCLYKKKVAKRYIKKALITLHLK